LAGSRSSSAEELEERSTSYNVVSETEKKYDLEMGEDKRERDDGRDTCQYSGAIAPSRFEKRTAIPQTRHVKLVVIIFQRRGLATHITITTPTCRLLNLVVDAVIGEKTK